MNKRIFMYATLPKIGQAPFGGGEVGNMRTIRMLREAGFDITTIRQRKADATGGKKRVLLSYPFRLLAGWSETFCKLLFGSRNSLVHLSGFAGKTIFNEYVLMHIMKEWVTKLFMSFGVEVLLIFGQADHHDTEKCLAIC